MSELLIYQAKVAVIITVFYFFYRVIASSETYHKLNRIVLIFSTLLSFILPFCIITIYQAETIQEIPLSQNLYFNQLQNQLANQKTDWCLVLGIIYIIGVATIFSCMIRSYMKIKKLINRCTIVEHSANTKIYSTKQNITPCSWLNNIIISESDINSDANVIIAHEKAHVELRHSFDVILIDILCIIQWFNPTIWLIRSSLKEIHEYQADSSVISQGFNSKNYQLLLIKKVVGYESYSMANNLNHSSLKNRITMMLSKKSSVASRLKLLYVVPLIGISLTAFAQTKTVSQDVDSKGNKNSATTKTGSTYYKSETTENGTRHSTEVKNDGTFSVNYKAEIMNNSDSSINKSFEATFFLSQIDNNSQIINEEMSSSDFEEAISKMVTENGKEMKITILTNIVTNKETNITEIKNIIRKLGLLKAIYSNNE